MLVERVLFKQKFEAHYLGPFALDCLFTCCWLSAPQSAVGSTGSISSSVCKASCCALCLLLQSLRSDFLSISCVCLLSMLLLDFLATLDSRAFFANRCRSSSELRSLVAALMAAGSSSPIGAVLNGGSVPNVQGLVAAGTAGGVLEGGQDRSADEKLTPRQLYVLNRVLEALEYGSGQDYKL